MFKRSCLSNCKNLEIFTKKIRISDLKMRWAGSAGGPPLRLLWMDPAKDCCVGTALPQRTFGAVFPDRARRRLRSPPPHIFPRILPWKSGFQPGLSAAAGAPPRIARRSARRIRALDGMASCTRRCALRCPAQGLGPLPHGGGHTSKTVDRNFGGF
jgi:hypothetical protein